MEQRTINFLKMNSSVITGLNKEKAVWEGEVEIVDLFSRIEQRFIKIEGEKLIILGTDKSGFTIAKNGIFDSIIQKTFKLNRKLSGYAKLRNDYELLPLVDVSLSGLTKGTEMEAVDRCLAIVNRATVLLPKLTTFKVTEALLTIIKQLIKDYKSKVDQRTTVSSDVSVTGEDIDEGISELRSNLEILDDLIEGLIDDEEFIARYKGWRKIIDYGKGKTLPNKPKAKVE